MDTKGSITDTTIHILPSIKLQQYLFTLENEADVPISILQYIAKSKLSNNITKNNEETIVNDVKGADDEQDLNLPKEDEIKPKENEMLCIDDIKWLSKYLIKVQNDGDIIYLHELFEGSDVILPENETIKRNPVLEARCVKLRRDQMNRDYRSMTKNVDNVRVRHPEETISYQSEYRHCMRCLLNIYEMIFILCSYSQKSKQAIGGCGSIYHIARCRIFVRFLGR